MLRPLAVVLLLGDARNHGLVRCATKLLWQLRAVGKWKGPTYVLVNHGAQLPNNLTAEPVYVTPFTMNRYHGSTAPYDKFYLFTMKKFRSYRALLYLDVDGDVRQSIAPLWQMLAASNKTILLRDNGPGVGKHSYFKNEVRGGVRAQTSMGIKDSKNPGATCFMLINTQRLDPPSVMYTTLLNAVNRFHSLFLYADQSAIGLVFRNDYAVFAPCLPLKTIGADEQAPPGWFLDHCRAKVDIYNHDYKKQCAHM